MTARFIGEEELKKVFADKRVVVIGSAPTVLKNSGKHIDGHDLVVRVNNYKTEGLAQEVGRRTDVHFSFYGSSIKKTTAELMAAGVRLCMCKCPNSKPFTSEWHERNGMKYGTDFRYIYKKREAFWFCDTYIPTDTEFMEQFNILGKHIPTTGFSAIWTLLQTGLRELYITGFDFFASGLHNVNEPWHDKNPDDPIRHVPGKELALVKDMAKCDRRIKLDAYLKSK